MVTLSIATDFSRAMATDELEGTISYAESFEVVKAEMDIPSQLVENVAGRIGRSVLEHFQQVTAIDISITKLNPPLGADCMGAGVEAHITR